MAKKRCRHNVCGKAGCRCKGSPPQKHGPYSRISYTRKGKSGTRFVRREDLPMVKRQLRTYARLKELIDRWVSLATELSNLRLEEQR